MATHPAPGICWAFVTFSSLRASCLLGGVARSHARGDATARGGERKLSLSSALEAACSRVPSLLASLAIIEEPARRVFFLGKLQSPSLGPGGSKKDPSQDNTPPHAPLYLYCMSFNLVERRAWYIIYQSTCKKAVVFLIGPDTVTDTIFFLGPVQCISGYFWIRNFFFPDTAFVRTYPVYPAYESVTFWICSPGSKFFNTPWIRNRVNAKSGYFFQWHYKIKPSSLPWISKTVPSAMLSLLYLMDFSFKFQVL